MRELPRIFNQHDYPDKLGSSPTATIATDGCLITCYAMLSAYYGKDTDPSKINQYMTEHNLYADGDLVSGDDCLTKIYPDILYKNTEHFETIPADLGLLHSLMDDPHFSVILDIDMGNNQHHFVCCVGCNGHTTIVNPWTGMPEDFTLNYKDPSKNILRFIVFSGLPAQSVQAIEDSLRLDRDKNWNLFSEQLTKSNNLQLTIDALQKEINDLKQENELLTTDAKETSDTNRKLTTENASLTGDLAKAHQDMADYLSKDKTAVEAGQDASEHFEEAQVVLQTVTQKVGVTQTDFPTYGHWLDAILAGIENLLEGKQTTTGLVKSDNIIDPVVNITEGKPRPSDTISIKIPIKLQDSFSLIKFLKVCLMKTGLFEVS